MNEMKTPFNICVQSQTSEKSDRSKRKRAKKLSTLWGIKIKGRKKWNGIKPGPNHAANKTEKKKKKKHTASIDSNIQGAKVNKQTNKQSCKQRKQTDI